MMVFIWLLWGGGEFWESCRGYSGEGAFRLIQNCHPNGCETNSDPNDQFTEHMQLHYSTWLLTSGKLGNVLPNTPHQWLTHCWDGDTNGTSGICTHILFQRQNNSPHLHVEGTKSSKICPIAVSWTSKKTSRHPHTNPHPWDGYIKQGLNVELVREEPLP